MPRRYAVGSVIATKAMILGASSRHRIVSRWLMAGSLECRPAERQHHCACGVDGGGVPA